MTHVVVLHAYSARNSGDGLLVDGTARLLEDTFKNASLTLVALDPDSFPGYSERYHPFTGQARTPSRREFLTSLRRRRLHPIVRKQLDRADLAVAVGGGYLRAASGLEYLKTVLAHRPQMATQGDRTPVIYLPQSIGPLPPRLTPGFGHLGSVHLVTVRDDRSLNELRTRGIRAERFPDLAAMAIQRTFAERSGPGADVSHAGRVGLVLRSLDRPRRYLELTTELAKRIDAELLVQSSGRGNDDVAFYESLGFPGTSTRLVDRLSSADRPSVTVSVRLHGSLQSLLSGVPSIHLSYERKGWGAYEDLGISEFVHNARDFDVDGVVSQVHALRSDPSSYWSALQAALPAIGKRRQELKDRLSGLANR